MIDVHERVEVVEGRPRQREVRERSASSPSRWADRRERAPARTRRRRLLPRRRADRRGRARSSRRDAPRRVASTIASSSAVVLTATACLGVGDQLPEVVGALERRERAVVGGDAHTSAPLHRARREDARVRAGRSRRSAPRRTKRSGCSRGAASVGASSQPIAHGVITAARVTPTRSIASSSSATPPVGAGRRSGNGTCAGHTWAWAS